MRPLNRKPRRGSRFFTVSWSNVFWSELQLLERHIVLASNTEEQTANRGRGLRFVAASLSDTVQCELQLYPQMLKLQLIWHNRNRGPRLRLWRQKSK